MKSVDDFEFGKALNIETENVFVQAKVDFPIGFAHTSVHDFTSGKTCLQRGAYLTTAHTVGSQACLGYHVEHFGVGIRFYGIMNLIPLVFGGFGCDGTKRRAKQVGVVIVPICIY